MLNSKNEYNCFIIPRLGFELDKDEAIAEYEENEKGKAIRGEIQSVKEKLWYEKEIQKNKRRKLNKKKRRVTGSVVKERIKEKERKKEGNRS